ncbi:hypothetical protein [Alkalitalea saponilacus]|uniref:Uncharacterized protein n=1 Tax=Alkalitalea saponilacus TaxID=889453 RepID=A0A1T5EZ91_9BACT|nr:hypothetical protein [Alkalitalea saponilacus]ASB47963.1 hypothetical protein CDL62_01745 [Alkalitalea saponilacus]SKB89181.1 hypothetical protein SAMN03080601_01468 [Alkalitalea saponilacus]
MFEGNYIVPINSEEKFMFLEGINESTFNEFWYVKYPNNNKIHSKETSRTELLININGKYVDYIRKLEETDPLFQDLHEVIMSTGYVLSTSMIIFLAENESIDFNLIKNRLLAVVCIFLISEPIEKSRMIEANTYMLTCSQAIHRQDMPSYRTVLLHASFHK